MEEVVKTLPRHPAKYSPDVISIFSSWLSHYFPILDPFAGIGTWVHDSLVLNEIEFDWVSQAKSCRRVVGDATTLPFKSCAFPAAATSPTFGNRMADHHNAKDSSRRNTYTHAMGRSLHASNTGAVSWGPRYWTMHSAAWQEVHRVLQPSGYFAIHVSDFIASGVRVPVVKWHMAELKGLGFEYVTGLSFPKKGLREGANHNVRVGQEVCALWRKRG